ncbi:MAG: hypothetical protein U9M92_00450 [Patescibacteria group bacterium]|nr:hypothetical protein [Patescibacteria group bacterium]
MENNHPPQPKSKFVLWWVVFLLAVIIIAAVWLVVREREPSNFDNLATVSPLDARQNLSTGIPSPTLVVAEQLPGSVVYVTSVVVPGGAWVAIRTDDEGRPGRILGVGFFDDRVSTGAVDLNATTVAGQYYHAALYRNNGDERFDQDADTLWLDSLGQPISTRFSVTSQLRDEKV